MILHVVTLISPDQAYGGPVSVALNQAQVMNARGHQVVIAAGSRGYSSLPTEIEGTRVHLFRSRQILGTRGFGGFYAPGLLIWFVRNRRAIEITHVHLARDFTTAPIALLAALLKIPLVLQTHGMVDRKLSLTARIFDFLMMRPSLSSASSICYLTSHERRALASIFPKLRLNLTKLTNGIRVTRPPTRDENPKRVVYISRLHERKQPMHFVQAAAHIATLNPSWRFDLYGPDEGELDSVLSEIERLGVPNIRYRGLLSRSGVKEELRTTAIFVLPSRDEPFPMAVLEAMSARVAVVVTDSCGLATAIDDARAGLVTDGTVPSLQSAMQRLISDSAFNERCANAAAELVRKDFDIQDVGRTLEGLYRSAAREMH